MVEVHRTRSFTSERFAFRMRSRPLLEELPAELDVCLEVDEALSVTLSSTALESSGLQPGELIVDVHPLSLRLEPAGKGGGRLPGEVLLAQLDSQGRIWLPVEPPRLSSRAVRLQVRRRGPFREVHLLADFR